MEQSGDTETSMGATATDVPSETAQQQASTQNTETESGKKERREEWSEESKPHIAIQKRQSLPNTLWFRTLALLAGVQIALSLYFSVASTGKKETLLSADDRAAATMFQDKASAVIEIVSNPLLSDSEIRRKLTDLHMSGLDVYGFGPSRSNHTTTTKWD